MITVADVAEAAKSHISEGLVVLAGLLILGWLHLNFTSQDAHAEDIAGISVAIHKAHTNLLHELTMIRIEQIDEDITECATLASQTQGTDLAEFYLLRKDQLTRRKQHLERKLQAPTE